MREDGWTQDDVEKTLPRPLESMIGCRYSYNFDYHSWTAVLRQSFDCLLRKNFAPMWSFGCRHNFASLKSAYYLYGLP